MNDCVYRFIGWWKCPMKWKRLFKGHKCNTFCSNYASVNTRAGIVIFRQNGGNDRW